MLLMLLMLLIFFKIIYIIISRIKCFQRLITYNFYNNTVHLDEYQSLTCYKRVI